MCRKDDCWGGVCVNLSEATPAKCERNRALLHSPHSQILWQRVNSGTPFQGSVLRLQTEQCATAAEPVFTEVHG